MIIIHGPQGCGKTTYAQALAEHFGCSSIQDDWNGSDAPIGELVLTSSTIKANLSALLDARVIRFDEALRLAVVSSRVISSDEARTIRRPFTDCWVTIPGELQHLFPLARLDR